MSFRSLVADLLLGGNLGNQYTLGGAITIGTLGGLRIVVDGQHNAILFYNAGNQLVLALAPTAGSDGAGNNFPIGLKVGMAGQAGVVLGYTGTTGLLYFPGVVANVSGDANLQLNHQGAGNAAQSFLTASSATDNVQLDRVALNLFASSHDGTAKAQIAEAYVDSLGAAHFYRHLSYSGCVIDAGSITAVDPTTGTAPGTPAVAESWHALAYSNAWTNFAGHQAGRYRKTATGRCELDGDIAPGTFVNATTVTSVPAAYAPVALRSYIRQTEGNAGGTYSIDVASTGVISVNDIVGAAPPIVDLSMISWPLT
jgi:hypothetical protein